MLALQQQPVKQLTCTSAAGAVICCTVKPPIEGPDKPREISVQCTSPSGIVTELTADGQVNLCSLIHQLCLEKHVTMQQTNLRFDSSAHHSAPVPLGRWVATHGPPEGWGHCSCAERQSAYHCRVAGGRWLKVPLLCRSYWLTAAGTMVLYLQGGGWPPMGPPWMMVTLRACSRTISLAGVQY